MHIHDAITGGLKKDIHFCHVEPNRDFKPWMVCDVRTVKAGDACPLCKKPVYEKKGNELGHIFKLGYKYTKGMHVSYLDEQGKEQTPTMGCYGIGVDRTLASIIEEHHDKDGIVWPMSVAPFHVMIIPVKFDGAMKDIALQIHDELTRAGIEVLLDDRDERPGVKFKDSDLVGSPLRIVIGEKNLPLNVELKERNKSESVLVPVDEIVAKVKAIVASELELGR